MIYSFILKILIAFHDGCIFILVVNENSLILWSYGGIIIFATSYLTFIFSEVEKKQIIACDLLILNYKFVLPLDLLLINIIRLFFFKKLSISLHFGNTFIQ